MSFSRTQSERTYAQDHEKYNANGVKQSASGIYNSAAVACDSAVGSLVGRKILEQNGSVVDAAIGCLLCNGILNAQSMGIGGGFFMLHYSRKDEKVTVIDARETAPMRSTADMFRTVSKTKGGLSIAVPGEVKGYWLAHQMFGSMKWSKLFQPVIDMCNNGFRMPASQAKFLEYCESKILESRAMRETFINRMDQQLYRANSVVRRPRLARTLEAIARDGQAAFYDGVLTDAIVGEIQSAGGIVTRDDLRKYECLVKKPVTYRLSTNNVEVNTMPSPGCGILLNFMLAILDTFDYHGLVFDNERSESEAMFNHRFVEASKFAFGLRNSIGDESFNDSSELYERLANKDVIYEYRNRIKDSHVHPLGAYGSGEFVNDYGTSHTSIIGPNGDAVAITSSINLVFGSKVMGERTNIIYNNQMDDFSSPEAEVNSFSLPNYAINYIEPGKRPVSSMTPLIAINEDKSVRLVCGSSGGTRIITSTALTAARNLLLKQGIQQSVDDPRLHQQLFPDEVSYEGDFDPDVLNRLGSKGHRLVNFGSGGSAVQAIERLSDGRLHAVSDFRKGGVPNGF